MKKTALMLSLCLGFLLVSCEKNAKVNNKTPEKQTNKEVVKTKPVKREVTKHPDTIIDGVRIYNFKSESAKERVVSIDEGLVFAAACLPILNKFFDISDELVAGTEE